MGSHFTRLLLTIGISILGMPVAGVAQAPNPLRSFQGVPFGNYQSPSASPIPVTTDGAPRLPFAQDGNAQSGNARSGNAQNGNAQDGNSEIPVEVRAALSPNYQATATEGMPTDPIIATESESEPPNDLGTLHQMLDSFQREGAVANEPGRLNSNPRLDRSTTGLRELGEDRLAETEAPLALPPSPSRFDGERFQKLIRSLIFNTCIVMCVGVAFILMAKQWYKSKKPAPRGLDPTIQITSTLRLGPKSNLFLVEAGGHRLIVASDQNGIKSVVPLTDSFSSTLDSLSEIADDGEATSTDDRESVMSGLYSLASVGETNTETVSRPARPQQDAEDEIRRKMEKALGEHGLKDLFLQTLQSNR